MNVNTLNSTSAAAAPQGQLREKFDQFVGESMFGQMLKSMRESVGKPAYFHGGRAEEVFQSQLDQLLVEKISDASAEQISQPMFELFTANMGNRHEASELNSFVSEDEAQQAIQQLDSLQQQNKSQDSASDSAALSQLDISIQFKVFPTLKQVVLIDMTLPMPSTAEPMSPPLNLENETAIFLQELSDVQADLLNVLHRKREQMVANDLEAMEQTMVSEQALLERLDQLRDSRQTLLADARGKGLPSDSMHSLARALDEDQSGELATKAHTAKDAMRHIQNETLTNFVLAQQTVLHLSQLLQIIATGGKLKPTYEAENASNQGGTLVDQDAQVVLARLA